MATVHTRRTGQAGSTARRLAPALLLAAAAVLVLTSQLAFDPAAETGEAWHWIQHGVVFLAGAAAGGAAALVYAAGRRGA